MKVEKIEKPNLTFEGKIITLQEWAENLGIDRTTLSKRINKYKWCIPCCLTIKAIKGNNKGCNHK